MIMFNEKNIDKYIIIADWLVTYITQEPYIFAKNLKNFGWNIILLSKLNVDDFKNKKCIILCITYDSFDIYSLKKDNITLVYKVDDIIPGNSIRNKCINSADLIVGPYQYLFTSKDVIDMYSNINKKKSYHIPYSAVNEFYEDITFNTNPINKVFSSGSVNYVYPLRQYIQNNINKDYIDVLPHAGYDNNNRSHEIVNNKYYQQLNKYLCCFTDGSTFRYVLLKVFEICSVGSCLLVDDLISEQLNILGFIDNINCIMCNKDNMEVKIKWILNKQNRHSVNLIRKRGMDLVRTNHNTNSRANQFNTIINNEYLDP